MIKLKANSQDGTFLKATRSTDEKIVSTVYVYPNIPWLISNQLSNMHINTNRQKAFYDVYNRKDWDSICLQQISLIPPMLHFVKHPHSPPQVLSDSTVIRKYKRQGHGAHEVIPGTQKRRTCPMAKDRATAQEEIWISGAPRTSAHRRWTHLLLSQLSMLKPKEQPKAQVSVTSA